MNARSQGAPAPIFSPTAAHVVTAMLVAAALLGAAPHARAQSSLPTPAVAGPAVAPLKVTGDPRRMSQGAKSTTPRIVPEGEPLPTQLPPPRKPQFDPKAQLTTSSTSLLREGPSAPGQISAPIVNAAGMAPVALPPDTVGDVGPTHYVQMVNNGGPNGSTGFFILRKDGTAPPARPAPALSGSGPFDFSLLWPAGNACATNLGDPIVVYDHLADRWLLHQFARPGGPGTNGFFCTAISQTADITDNLWFVYTMLVHTNLPDYPKIGVWPDGYYVTTYENPNLAMYVLDRANMLIGNAAGFFKSTIGALGTAGVRDTRILPADLDGPAPPAGTPGLFARTVDNQQDPAAPANDRIEIYEGTVNWNAGTFNVALVDTITPAAFDIMTCNRGGTDVRSCIPQPPVPGGGTQNLDALSNRPMMQLKYRNFGGHQMLTFNQTIDVQGSIQPLLGFPPGNEVAGVRWFELRKTAANWTIHQEGTYAPQPNGAAADANLLHRWMGSIAMDRFGNMALGYSIVNSDAANPVFAGIRYTGRRFDDVLGLMPQGEQVVLAGTVNALDDDAASTAPAPLSERWGDYSAMNVDPVDDCTFWYTTHVAGGAPVAPAVFAARPTRIASFRFSDCATDLVLSKTGSPNIVTAGGLLNYTLTVTNLGPLNASGVTIVDTLPAGVAYQSNNAGCTLAGNTLTCNLGVLNKDQSRSVQVLVRVLAATSGTVTNVATVSSNQGESNPDNNTATLVTQVVSAADLSITKQCKPDGAAPSGSTATCTMFVFNAGPSDAQSVVITDTLLSNGSFTILNASVPGGSCGIASNVVTCTLASLAAGGSAAVTVNFTAAGNIDVNDTARVTSATPDPDMSNNTATGKVTFVATADLAITKIDLPDPVVAGTELTYTIGISNTGPAAADNVVVTDILPAQVKVLAATPSVGSCGGTTGAGDPLQPVTCNLGTLANGASASVTVLVKVNSDVPQDFTLVNNATVASAATDPNNANNKATATTFVHARADLVAAKTSDKAVYKPSSLVTYTVTVTNQGPSNALAVEVIDNLPVERQALYKSDTGGCTKSGLTLTCRLGDMPVGTTRSFNVYMVVKGSRGDVTNKATAVSKTTDPNDVNNLATRIVRIGN